MRTSGKKEGGETHTSYQGNADSIQVDQVAREGYRGERVTEDPNSVKKGKVVSWRGETEQ